jgi:hypothetical protein
MIKLTDSLRFVIVEIQTSPDPQRPRTPPCLETRRRTDRPARANAAAAEGELIAVLSTLIESYEVERFRGESRRLPRRWSI